MLKEELNYDLFNLKSQHSLNFPFLNDGQKIIYDLVVAVILQKKQTLIFVHGMKEPVKLFYGIHTSSIASDPKG
jgi:hypothetical protein